MNGQNLNEKPPLPSAGYAERSRGGDLLLRIRSENRPPIDAWIPDKDLSVLLESMSPTSRTAVPATIFRRRDDGTVMQSGSVLPSKSRKGLVFRMLPEGGVYTVPVSQVRAAINGSAKMASIAVLSPPKRDEVR